MFVKTFYSIFILLFISVELKAQNYNENNMSDISSINVVQNEWVPNLLGAVVSPAYHLLAYNAGIFSWQLRGENATTTIIDGINWQSKIQDWNGAKLFTNMKDMFKNSATILNHSFSKTGYFKSNAVHLLNTDNAAENKSFLVSNSFYASTNNYQLNTLSIKYHSGYLRPGFKLSSSIKAEYAPIGNEPNGYMKSMDILYAFDKKLNPNGKIEFTFLWKLSDRARAATSTLEAFQLSQNFSYHPNWGWYHNQPYYPSTQQNNNPVISMRFLKNWDTHTSLNISLGLIMGKESSSNLEWSNTADPRPDYYKYMPSYLADTILRKALIDWYLQDPGRLQINFDRFEKINKASKGGRSFYIVNQENHQLRMFHGSALMAHTFKNQDYIQAGIDYALDKIHNYNTIKDLLGGMFYYNYNTWMNDDSIALSFQQDKENPDRKIKQGEKWGADYTILAVQLNPWIQFHHESASLATAIAFGQGFEGLERKGFNQNGLYTNSKGSVGMRFATPSNLNAQLQYKYNGRLYFRSILSLQWMSPSFQSVFLDPTMHANASAYALQVANYSCDLSVFYRSPSIQSSFSIFQKYLLNQADDKMFYHDAYGLFVYGIIGHINSIQNGFEFELETSPLDHLQVVYANSFLNSYYTNNPNYQYWDVNHLQQKESGFILVKDLNSGTSPKYINALSIIYRPFNGINFGCASVLAQDRPIEMNLFRRTEWVKQKIDPITWHQIQSNTYLDDQFTVNAFVNKSFQIKASKFNKNAIRWNLFFTANNIFNKTIPLFAFEQTRFDYLKFNKDKYALKYLMNSGTRFSFQIQIQIQ